MPSAESEEDLRFMECSPTPPISATPVQAPLLPPASSLPPPPILFKLRDYFHSQPPTPTFYDAYSDERFIQITRHPLIILSQTQLDYLLSYLERIVQSASLIDRYHLYYCVLLLSTNERICSVQ
jgi:hypothetical protein